MSMPLTLDTNLLEDLLTNDDPEQANRAAAFLDASPACFVPITVFLELEWVLGGAYILPRALGIHAVKGADGHPPSAAGAGRAGGQSPGMAPAWS